MKWAEFQSLRLDRTSEAIAFPQPAIILTCKKRFGIDLIEYIYEQNHIQPLSRFHDDFISLHETINKFKYKLSRNLKCLINHLKHNLPKSKKQQRN